MAMIDYGAIAFKNGKLLSTEFFGDMKEMVGWEDTENDVYKCRAHMVGEPETAYMRPIKLKGNYFAYIGDKDCTIAFYKEQIVIVQRYDQGDFNYIHEYFNCTSYIWSRWENPILHKDCDSTVRVTKRNGYLVCKWKYKGDKYKVYFGYGVDVGYYQKYHIVNAYRTPAFIWKHRILRWFKDKIYRCKNK